MTIQSGIYAIVRKGTEDMYIGSSNNIPKRMKRHFSQLRNNNHHSKYLQNVYNKYGIDALEIRILETVEVENLISREQYYLDLYQPVFNSNKEAGRTVIYGLKRSEEAKAKMREAAANRKAAGLKRKRNPHTEETRNRISAAQKGKPRPWQRKNEVSL